MRLLVRLAVPLPSLWLWRPPQSASHCTLPPRPLKPQQIVTLLIFRRVRSFATYIWGGCFWWTMFQNKAKACSYVIIRGMRDKSISSCACNLHPTASLSQWCTFHSFCTDRWCISPCDQQGKGSNWDQLQDATHHLSTGQMPSCSSWYPTCTMMRAWFTVKSLYVLNARSSNSLKVMFKHDENPSPKISDAKRWACVCSWNRTSWSMPQAIIASTSVHTDLVHDEYR